MADTASTCTTCKKTAEDAKIPNLKVCAKCKGPKYCSRDCQKADWKTHKKVCSQISFQNLSNEGNGGSGSSSSTPHVKGLEKHKSKPFHDLDNGKYLHDRPQNDVFKLLIDCFRLRQDDNKWLDGKTSPNSVYTGASSSIQPFREFLGLAASRSDLLPSWWNESKQQECEAFSESGNWSDLRKKAGKQDIISHYGDNNMPMQLRMLGEEVYGTGPGGQGSAGMRGMMMQMERGLPDGMASSRLSLR